MNTQQLQYILEVYRTKSISKAAEKLYVAQPNLSNSIRSLENELGYLIFKRTKHGVTPTEKGVLVLKHAHKILSSYQELQQLNSNVKHKRLHIGSVSFAPICRAFERLCVLYQGESNVDLSLSSDVQIDFDALTLSDFDIQIGLILPQDINSFTARAEAKGVSVTVLKDIPVVLRIGPHHPLYHKKDAVSADFSRYMFVDYIGEVYRDYPGLNGLIPIDRKRVITVDDRTTKHRLVSNGEFISMGCKLPADLDEAYSFRNIDLGGLKYTLVLLEWKNQRRSPDIEKYIQFLMEELEAI